MSRRIHKAWLVIASVATLSAILVGSFIPEPDSRETIGKGTDWNSLHIPAYALFVAVLLITLRVGEWYRHPLPVAVIAGSLLGIAIELIQPMAGRSASLIDIALNQIGVGIGATLAQLIVPRLQEFTFRDPRG